MNKTLIEWVKNPDGTQGYTWNPVTGCLNHTPEGLCLGGLFPCYAYKLANGRLRKRYLANPNIAPFEAMGLSQVSGTIYRRKDPFYPRFWEERLDDLRTWTPAYMMPPRGIFVCDMGELFGDWIPREWQERIFDVIKQCSQHRFYLLTKQPQNLAKWSPFPQNCYVGVTATDNQMFNYALAHLSEVEASTKFISLEPLLSRIEPVGIGSSIIDWLIIGAQTKPYKPPKIEWVEEIVRAADKAGIPIFLKDNLELNKYEPFGAMRDPLYKRQGEYKTLELRQEIPE